MSKQATLEATSKKKPISPTTAMSLAMHVLETMRVFLETPELSIKQKSLVRLTGYASVFGAANIYGVAKVFGNVRVCGKINICGKIN